MFLSNISKVIFVRIRWRKYGNHFDKKCKKSLQNFQTFLHFQVLKEANKQKVKLVIFAPLCLSWNFSSAENIVSLSLQDRPWSGIIVGIIHLFKFESLGKYSKHIFIWIVLTAILIFLRPSWIFLNTSVSVSSVQNGWIELPKSMDIWCTSKYACLEKCSICKMLNI